MRQVRDPWWWDKTSSKLVLAGDACLCFWVCRGPHPPRHCCPTRASMLETLAELGVFGSGGLAAKYPSPPIKTIECSTNCAFGTGGEGVEFRLGYRSQPQWPTSHCPRPTIPDISCQPAPAAHINEHESKLSVNIGQGCARPPPKTRTPTCTTDTGTCLDSKLATNCTRERRVEKGKHRPASI